MLIVRQSTARTVIVGPILDSTGAAVTTAVVGDLKISKNGAAPAALNGSSTLTHRNTGHYSLALTTSDVDTVGQAEVVIDATTNAMPVKELTVVEEAVYDQFYAVAAAGALQPTVAGRTLDVSATGEAGVDWANVGGQGTTVNLSATTVGVVASLTAMAANCITATAIATGAFTAAKFAAGAFDAVWTVAARLLTAGTNIVLAKGTGVTGFNDPTATQNADALLTRDWTAVAAPAARSVLNALRFLRNKWTLSAGTLTVFAEDDATPAWTGTATTAASNPVDSIDPT